MKTRVSTGRKRCDADEKNAAQFAVSRASTVYMPVIVSGVDTMRSIRPIGPGSRPRWKKKRKIAMRANQKSGSAPASIP